MILPLKVTTIPHELGRFHVTSETNPKTRGPYTVDIEPYEGSGMCSCQHWCCRLRKKAESGIRGPEIRCKHLEAVRNFIVDKVIANWRRKGLISKHVEQE